MKIVIIEDEYPAQERLKKLISKIDSAHQILITIDSVQTAIDWFKNNDDFDLVFMDIQLADGLSLNIFDAVEIKKPIIFTTAFDEYALDAFEVNSIDYLLKPINESRLRKSFEKIKLFSTNDNYKMLDLISSLTTHKKNYKSRFLVKVGSVMHPISIDKIVLFFMENQLTKLKTSKGNIYTIDHSLDEIESSINPNDFFRISRQMIVSANAVRKIESYFSHRLILTLEPAHKDVIVSKRKTSSFKDWIE